MVTCKLCGRELGLYQDYDQVLFHCWKYHLDVFESYDGDDRRNIILSSKQTKTEEK